jgi:NADPH:quinone reductase-like Zn-dependent oxidoreductase
MTTTTQHDTMTAVIQDRYGPVPEDALRLGEVPVPMVGPDEVLVRVRAASVDFGTWHLMTGLPYAMRLLGFGFRRPKAPNPGRSLAGTVVAVGGGVRGLEPGDDVYGSADGSFAELAVGPADQLTRKPANLSFEQAAAVPVSAVAALQAVRDHAQPQAGEKVLIIWAAGGVGSYAVQIARSFGAEVTGVAGASDLELVRSLGADHVVDYTSEEITDRGVRYDAIVDTAGNRPLGLLRRALTPTGRLVVVGGETDGRWLGGSARMLRAPMLSPFVSQKLTVLSSKENADDLAALRELIEDGMVAPAIGRTFPLSETPAAVRLLRDDHAHGKLVITL